VLNHGETELKVAQSSAVMRKASTWNSSRFDTDILRGLYLGKGRLGSYAMQLSYISGVSAGMSVKDPPGQYILGCKGAGE